MHLEKLKIINFRNFDSLDVEFDEGVNVIVGENGAGKTSILEAIYFLGNLTSFRTVEDENLIKEGAKFAQIKAEALKKEIDITILKEEKHIKINEIPYKKYREYLGNINVISFHPEDVYFFKDAPKIRRIFLDKEISKVDEVYLSNIIVFNKMLKQRNKILKSNDRYKEKLLKVIDVKMAKLQSNIILKRDKFLKQLEEKIKEIKSEFDFKYEVEINYETFLEIEENILEERILQIYKEGLESDLEKMITNIGIHRDDWDLKVNGSAIKNYASQGEQRLIIIILKLALAKLVKDNFDKAPLLVLDDVLFELDEEKKQQLLEQLENFEQSFISSCSNEEIKQIKKKTPIYFIKNGKLIEKERKQ